MLLYLLKSARHLVRTFTANDSPRQVAWGFVLGMMIGLLPKGNLIVIGLTALLCGLQVNKQAGLWAAGIFSMLGLLLDGLAHRIGTIVLLWEPARPLYTWLVELPLGFWLGINNTVVLGQLLIGLYFAFPTYYFAYQLAERFQPPLRKWLLRTVAGKVDA